MKQLLCIIIMSSSVIGMLYFCVRIMSVTDQNAITPTVDPTTLHIDLHTPYLYQLNDSACECIKYNCGCCQHVELDAISLNGTLCANASYLEYDYGISITLTYNYFTIINETVSARNPPPICFGEDIIDSIEFEICLHIYDIDVGSDKFHACFEILEKIMKLKISTIKLGCVNTKLHKNDSKYSKIYRRQNNFNSSRLFLKKILKNSI